MSVLAGTVNAHVDMLCAREQVHVHKFIYCIVSFVLFKLRVQPGSMRSIGKDEPSVLAARFQHFLDTFVVVAEMLVSLSCLHGL